MSTESNNLDLVWGADRIGEVLGASTRKAFHLLESGLIPARKVGNRWVAERSKLREFFLESEEAK